MNQNEPEKHEKHEQDSISNQAVIEKDFTELVRKCKDTLEIQLLATQEVKSETISVTVNQLLRNIKTVKKTLSQFTPQSFLQEKILTTVQKKANSLEETLRKATDSRDARTVNPPPEGSPRKSLAGHYLLDKKQETTHNGNGLKELGITVGTVPRDGNCLFQALAELLEKQESQPCQATRLRQEVCDLGLDTAQISLSPTMSKSEAKKLWEELRQERIWNSRAGDEAPFVASQAPVSYTHLTLPTKA